MLIYHPIFLTEGLNQAEEGISNSLPEEAVVVSEGTGLAAVLAAARDAAPVNSLDVVARDLRVRFGARYVSFLFVDVVGGHLLRVSDMAGTSQETGTPRRTGPSGSPCPAAASTTRCCGPRSRCGRRRTGRGSASSRP